jgi:hypothetical protein
VAQGGEGFFSFRYIYVVLRSSFELICQPGSCSVTLVSILVPVREQAGGANACCSSLSERVQAGDNRGSRVADSGNAAGVIFRKLPVSLVSRVVLYSGLKMMMHDNQNRTQAHWAENCSSSAGIESWRSVWRWSTGPRPYNMQKYPGACASPTRGTATGPCRPLDWPFRSVG